MSDIRVRTHLQKPGKVGEFDVREIVVCLWCATAVAIVTK